MRIEKYWKHLCVISKHKWYVMRACFKVGLYKQGLLHDLSKFMPTEFTASARHFQGNRSPIDAEKDELGYSIAWQHHKGHNKHHWQYWTDFTKGEVFPLRMPPQYVAEMICDWVGAGKAYNPGAWTIDTFKEWYQKNRDNLFLEPAVRFHIARLIAGAHCEKDIYKWARPDRVFQSYKLYDMVQEGEV